MERQNMVTCNIQEVYIADGFADDCDELMHRCLQFGTLTFEIFSDLWKEMKLSCVFHGRASGSEIAELSEELLMVAKNYMVADTGNFEESVAGLFLVYSLMNLQPYPNFAKLRIVQEDIPAIERIEWVARRDSRQDVLYILGSVLIKGPVQYQAVVRERGMENPIRKYLEGQTDRLGVQPKGVFHRQREELELVKFLRYHSVRYTTAKENIHGAALDDRSLKFWNTSFPNTLETSLKKAVSGVIIDEVEDVGASIRDDHIKNLKAKAMKSKVNPMRHLQGVEDRSKNTSSPEPEPEPSTSTAFETRAKKRVRNSNSDGDGNYTAKDFDDGYEDHSSEDELDLIDFTNRETEHEDDQEIEALEALRRSAEIECDDQQTQTSNSGPSSPSPSVSSADTRKRNLKRPILKSRFKRMGILPVAFSSNREE